MLRRLLPLLAAAVAALGVPAAAGAETYAPRDGHVLTGVTAGGGAAAFDAQTRHHSDVYQAFVTFDLHGGVDAALAQAAATGARPMLHLNTDEHGHETISPGAIARGGADDYLVWLAGRLARVGGPAYVRLFAEMDGHWNPYCAFDASGRSRGRDHSTASFRAAWRRVTLVLRGGDVATLNAALKRLGQRPLQAATGPGGVPVPQLAVLWVPQVAGAPDKPGNTPGAYWPGRDYVDWVGTDFYGKFPNFAGLERFAGDRRWRGVPFAFGEWALWGADDPRFVHRLFDWVRAHRQVKLLLYNQGAQPDGPFRLVRYPRALNALRDELRDPRFGA